MHVCTKYYTDSTYPLYRVYLNPWIVFSRTSQRKLKITFSGDDLEIAMS
jgi:hypothetical protein